MFLLKAKTGRTDFAWYLITVVLGLTGYFIGQIPFTATVLAQHRSGAISDEAFNLFMETQNVGVLGMNNNLVLFLLLWMFILAFIGLWLGVRRVHKKRFVDVLTARTRLDWSRIFFGFGFWMVAFMITEVVFYLLSPDNYIFQFKLAPFLILLVIVILLLPIQTSFEEIFFRGYLMQAFSLISKSRLFPLLLTSVLFGAMHFMNPEVKAFGLGVMMPYYIGVGLVLGVITLMDDGLELALGVHAATNIYGSLFVTFDSSAVQTNAIFKLVEVEVTGMTLGFFIASAIFVFVCARMYKWNNWSKAFGAVTSNSEHSTVYNNETFSSEEE